MFTHLYIEKKAAEYPVTKRVLQRSHIENVIYIDHYKDVFNRPGQDYGWQMRNGRSLILAVNDGNLIYEGAPLCQDFGFGDPCYSTSIMGCVFDCDYCFLKGMYKTGACVVFVNFDDYIKAVDDRLAKGPLYLSVSYESDLMSFDNLTGLSGLWEDLALTRPGLTIEIRTKAAPSEFKAAENIIYAFTLSPDTVRERFEHGTASTDARIRSVNRALAQGAQVRLCFDPLIYIKDAPGCYNDFMDRIIRDIDLTKVRDIGIGTFRIPSEYIRDLRKIRPESSAVNYPFENINGVMRYPEEIERMLLGIIKDKLEGKVGADRIYEI